MIFLSAEVSPRLNAQPVSAHVANGVLRGSSSDLYFDFWRLNYESLENPAQEVS
nr:MAG TPA: hypothetical protein [Bacteriophage sp.]